MFIYGQWLRLIALVEIISEFQSFEEDFVADQMIAKLKEAEKIKTKLKTRNVSWSL